MTWLQVGFQLLWLMFKFFVPCFFLKLFVCGKPFFVFWFFRELNIGEEKEENIE
jgi:hypothetical protein